MAVRDVGWVAWQPEQHTDKENFKWAWRRAIEWAHWPVFLAQPIVPALLYFFPWQSIVVLLLVVSFAWWAIVAPRSTPSAAAGLVGYFVALRYVTAPVMAYLIWQSDRPWIALLALAWPWLGHLAVGWVLAIPEEFCKALFAKARDAKIGPIQRRIIRRLGYVRRQVTAVSNLKSIESRSRGPRVSRTPRARTKRSSRSGLPASTNS